MYINIFYCKNHQQLSGFGAMGGTNTCHQVFYRLSHIDIYGKPSAVAERLRGAVNRYEAHLYRFLMWISKLSIMDFGGKGYPRVMRT